MATSLEGKRLSTSLSKLCEFCNINPAIKYCAECPIHLCDICTRGHRNLKYTKDHVLSDIGASSTTPVAPSTTTRGCHKHSNKKFTACCTECVQLICDSCKNDHKGHELIPLTSDAKLHQKVCSKNIQNLLDDLQEIDSMKTILEEQVTTYEDAIRVVDKWELDLLQMVKNKAAKLRKKLKELKDKKYKQLSDKVKGLMVQLQTIDQSITKLNSIRKSIDTQMLEKELSVSQELIDKLDNYKKELQPLPATFKVEDVLSNGDLMKEVDNVLESLFTEGDIDTEPFTVTVPKPVAEWNFSATDGGKDTSQYGENPIKLTNVTYGPGPRGEQNGALILPTSDDQTIVVENPSDRLRFSKTMTFFAHVYLQCVSPGPLLSVESFCVLGIFPDSKSLVSTRTGVDVNIHNGLTSPSWYKIAVVYDVSDVSIYVNGDLAGSAKGTVNLSRFHRGRILLGCRPQDSRRAKGRIATAKFFEVALSQEEIKRL